MTEEGVGLKFPRPSQEWARSFDELRMTEEGIGLKISAALARVG
jgi:hypothetical protein